MVKEFSDTFANSNACAYQWSHAVVNLGRNEFKFCCRTLYGKVPDIFYKSPNMDSLFNSESERQNRARMLLGEKIKGCEYCWKLEENGVQSPRRALDFKNSRVVNSSTISALDTVENHEKKVEFLSKSSVVSTRSIHTLEIILSNTCDMQCMYCSQTFSSRWAAERKKYGGELGLNEFDSRPPKETELLKNSLLSWFSVEGKSEVCRILFLGGEPSLISDFYHLSLDFGKILDTNSKSKTIIEIITNLNSTPQTFQKFIAHLIELSKYYKKVKLSISIEAFEKKTEYIRDGLSWNRWKENFETLMKLDINNVHIIILTTTNILSISSLHKLIVYVGHQMKTWRTSVDLSQNLVVFPQANSPLLLTADFSKYIDKAIQKIQHYAKYADSSTDSQKLYSKSWIEYIHSLELIKVSIQSHVLIESEKKLIREFYNQFDLRRGKNIYRVFPEYKNFLKKCGVYQRPRTLRTIFKDLGKYFI